MRTVRLALRHPGTTLALAALLLVAVQVAYGKFGRGVEFFPKVEPDYGQVIVHAAGNLALDEKNRSARRGREARARLRRPQDRLHPRRRAAARLSELTEDTIGVIQFEFADWRTRAPAHEIMDAIRDQDRGHSRHPGRGDGAARRAAHRQADPGADHARSIRRRCRPAAKQGRGACSRARDDIRDLDDGQPLPGIDWKIEVDKAEAAKYGAGVNTVGTAVQLVTNGLKATEYRPVDSDKSVDILVRFPPDRRSLDQIDELRCRPRWAMCRSAISCTACPRRASATSTASTATG